MIRCPKHLRDEAKEYWHKHWQRAVDEGRANEDLHVESFGLLCEIYRVLLHSDATTDGKAGVTWASNVKLYEKYAVRFGTLPDNKPKKQDNKPTNIVEALRKIAGD